MWRKVHDNETGLAMVTAVLVMFVLASLSIVVVGLAAHNATVSAFDRKRVQAIDAAEAGIDQQYATIAATVSSAMCSGGGTMTTSPSAQYSDTVQLYSDWPPTTPMSCPPTTGQVAKGVKIVSTGTAITSGSVGSETRTMQSEAQLTPVFPQFDQAIFSNLNLSLVNKLTLNGNNGNDGNVYTNGDLVMKNNTSVSGNVYAQGSATVQSSIIRATLWANGPVSLDSTTVFGDVLSSTGTVTISNNSHVYGSVKALGAITVSGNSQVDGQRVTGVNLGPPPALKFPQIGYNPTYWQSKGYVIQQYSDCTSAKNAIVAGFPSGQATVVRITSVCTLSFTNNSGATLAGDLAIITDGGFSTANQVTFTGAAANTKLYIIRPYETGLACSPPTPSPYDITLSNQSAINSINLFAYTQCTVNMGNNNSSGATAQVIAGVVNITNNMVLNYKNVTVPSDPVAYTASVSYIREVVNGTG